MSVLVQPIGITARECRVLSRFSPIRSEDSGLSSRDSPQIQSDFSAIINLKIRGISLHFGGENGDLRARVVDLARKAWLYCGGKLNFASLLQTHSRPSGADVLADRRRVFRYLARCNRKALETKLGQVLVA